MEKNTIQHLKDMTDIPVIMAPMFLISNPKMVVEACKNGIIGTFPALNARSGAILDDWMNDITTELAELRQENPSKTIGGWGVNFIVHRSNKRYVEDLKLIEKYQPDLVITSLGDPGPVAKIVHAYGGVVFSDVINMTYAHKAVEKGADGLVLVANGAGGHGGTFNPISFVHEVREFFAGPIALSGGITKGEDILVAELLGADYAYIGTRFIPADESLAQTEYKQEILDASIEDITYTDAFSGVNANYLTPSIVRAGLDPNNLKKKDEINFQELQDKNVKAWKDIWGAGHGVGSIGELQSTQAIIQELKDQYRQAVAKVGVKYEGIVNR